jgi:hypothetical protein
MDDRGAEVRNGFRIHRNLLAHSAQNGVGFFKQAAIYRKPLVYHFLIIAN